MHFSNPLSTTNKAVFIANKFCIDQNVIHEPPSDMKLTDKPQCAWCGATLLYVFDELKTGSATLRCCRCKKFNLVDFQHKRIARYVNNQR